MAYSDYGAFVYKNGESRMEQNGDANTTMGMALGLKSCKSNEDGWNSNAQLC